MFRLQGAVNFYNKDTVFRMGPLIFEILPVVITQNMSGFVQVFLKFLVTFYFRDLFY